MKHQNPNHLRAIVLANKLLLLSCKWIEVTKSLCLA